MLREALVFLGVASYYAHHETFHVSILTHFRCWSNVSPYFPPIGEHIEASNGSYRIKFDDAHATEVFRLFDTKMRAHAGWDFLFFFKGNQHWEVGSKLQLSAFVDCCMCL